MSCYRGEDKLCVGEFEHYSPTKFISPDLAASFQTRGGSGFYFTPLFLQKILGRPEGHG